VLLLHGFPELAYSWRKVMLPLAAAEYHVIAPISAAGCTTGWDDSDDAIDPFRILNMVRDAMGSCLRSAIAKSRRSATMRARRPAGARSSAGCSISGDMVRRRGVRLPFNTRTAPRRRARLNRYELTPNPLTATQYYQNYQRTRGVNDDMLRAAGPRLLPCLLPHKAPIGKETSRIRSARTARTWPKSPYYVERDKGMAATVAPFMPSAADRAMQVADEAEVDVRPNTPDPIHRRASGYRVGGRTQHCRDARSGAHRCAIHVYRGQ
jgi:hypothetical protein